MTVRSQLPDLHWCSLCRERLTAFPAKLAWDVENYGLRRGPMPVVRDLWVCERCRMTMNERKAA